MGKKKTTASGVMGRRLSTEKFDQLMFTLVKWREDPAVRLMDAKKDKGRVLQFVKGLRLSAQIAYLVRDIISGKNAEVSWGHLVDKDGKSCSPECDIIIHRPGYFHRWNGDESPIMNFKFIECSEALAVISCKSKTNSVDKGYCEAFAKYNVDNILLFAECCAPHRVDPLKKLAIAAGYSGFYYLYTLAKDGFTWKQDEQVYLDFAEKIRSAAD